MEHYIIFLLLMWKVTKICGITYVSLGDDATMLCSLTPSSNFNLKWYGPPNLQNGDLTIYYISIGTGFNPDLSPEHKSRLSIVGDYDLKISNVTQNDVGRYQCQVSFTENFDLRLIVEVTSVTISPVSFTCIEHGNNVQITCTTSESEPPATVTWYSIQQRSSTSKEIAKETSVTQTNKKTISTLSYSPQSEDNGGVIYCKAANTKQLTEAQSQNASVTVYYGAKAGSLTLNPPNRTYTVRESHALQVLCDADCNPACYYNWSKDGVFLQSSTELNLISVNRDEAGNYTCLAFNTHGSIKSQPIKVLVQYILLDMEKIEYTCDSSEIITITCTVSTNMKQYTFLTWEHKISNVTIRFLDGLTVHNQTKLNINICNYQDQGVYICRVRDGSQVTTEYSQLEINAEPVFVKKGILHSTTDRDIVQFFVEFYSNPKPTAVEWYKNTKRIFISEDYQQIWHPFNTTLTIYGKKVQIKGYRALLLLNKPTNDDFGTYILRLENPKGFAEIELTYEKQNTATNYVAIIGGTVASTVVVMIAVIVIVCILRKCHLMKKDNAEGKDERYETITSSNRTGSTYEGLHVYETTVT